MNARRQSLPGTGSNEPVSVVRLNSDENPRSDFRDLPPTLEAGAELQFAYSYFNDALFGGRLPDCVITYTRGKNVLGHFCPDRFQRVGGELRPELALNPTYLALRDDRDSLSTLVHEQAHVMRHYFGPPNRRGGRGTGGYHDIPWADMMEAVGLMPSDNGKSGGKRTGYHVTHYIIPGGPFDIACARLLDQGFRIHWSDRLTSTHGLGGDGDGDAATKPPQKKDRVKFTCPRETCGLNAWAKPTASLTCGFCGLPMVSADASASRLPKPA